MCQQGMVSKEDHPVIHQGQGHVNGEGGQTGEKIVVSINASWRKLQGRSFIIYLLGF